MPGLQSRAPLLAAIVTVVIGSISSGCVFAQDKPQDKSQDKSTTGSGTAQVSKAVGVIKSIQANSITIVAESGGEVTATLVSSTKILRVPPGEKDLKNATALQVQDLQPGDRVLIRGQASPDGDSHNIAALAVIVMKQADVAAKQQHDREDWQKRGVGGLVTQVDGATDMITISSGGVGTSRSVTVHIAKDTILRRYAPDSVNFDEAKPVPAAQFLAETKAGDQLRARGTRTPDGSELSAEEVVSGAFRNIAGIIMAIDTASNNMTVQDAISKSAVVVKVTPDSQIKKLPAEMAQRIAMRLKAMSSDADQPGANRQGQGQGQGPRQGMGSEQASAAGAGGVRPGAAAESQASRGPGGNGPPDFQRLLSRLPNSHLADLQKGDAVMIVSTEGGHSEAVTAITLLAGVEPILTAAPNRTASSLLSPWSLGAPGGEGEAAP
jgi:transcription antitermination factor NusG